MDSSIFQQFLLGLTAATNIILGLIILKKTPQALLNRLFFGFAVNTSLWNFTILMVTIQVEHDNLFFWVRISHAVAIFTSWFLFGLAHTFQEGAQYPYLKVYLMLFLTLMLSITCLTPVIIEDIIIDPKGNITYLYGTFFPLYLLLFSGVIILSLLKLFKELRSSKGLVRLKIRYFFGGILLSYIIGSLVNLFLPLAGIKAAGLRNIGPVSTLIAVTSITYAIARYRLMDIHLALRKILAYSFSVLLLVIISVVPILFLKGRFGFYLYSPMLIYYLVFLVIMVAAFFQPLKDSVQYFIDHYFYGGAYDYFDALKDANKAMVSILNREDLLAFLLDKIVKTAYIQDAAFYLKGPDGSFYCFAAKKWGGTPVETHVLLKPHSPLLTFLQEKGDILLKEDLAGIVKGERRGLLESEMDTIKAAVAVPLFGEGNLEGVFSLGPKLSGEPYSLEDVNLLTTIASQVTVALRNAQLYQEVLVIKQHLESILENMENGLITVASNGEVTTFNSAAGRLSGLTAAEVLGNNLGKVLQGVLYDLFLKTLNEGKGQGDVELVVEKENMTLFLSCSTALVELQGTQEQEVIIVLSDVTHVKELEQEKNRVLRLASLGEVAAGMAHEIKNPLVSIKTFAELLPDKYDDEEFRYTFSKIVRHEIERINRLLTDLLNFTKSSKLCYKEVSLGFLLDEIIAQLAHQLEEQKIKVHKLYQEGIPAIRVDRDQIKQAFFNICLNAVQAMPQGGELSIGVETVGMQGKRPEGDPVQVNGLRIIIKDTGKGISQKERERIFHPFFTTKPQGIGIGLSLSHKIITAHGGNIQFSSNGQGTIFEVRLPI
jgi:PAS domain S-box-containing protein